jgi:hypothetical protein
MNSLTRGGAVLVTGAAALALSACGGSSDKDKITSIIKDVGKHPANLCTKYASSQLLAQIGGKDRCLQAAQASSAVDPKIKVQSVSVTGTTASASIQGNTGHSTVGFQKVDGDWKVSSAGS